MKPTKKIYLYVNPPSLEFCEHKTSYFWANYPEDHRMPKEAVARTKKLIDRFLADTIDIMSIVTVSSDVTSFVHDYGKLKGCKVYIYYRSKRIGIEGVFGKFNEVFNYSSKLTEVEL